MRVARKHLAKEGHLKNLTHFLWNYGDWMNHLEADVTKVLQNQRIMSNSYHKVTKGERG